MSFITKYGSFWGYIPQTAGRVFWVAPAASYTVEGRTFYASDDNDGLAPERAFLTLDYAIGKCTANASDVIVLLPGAHSYSTTIAVDVAGITITGIPGGAGNPWRQKTSVQSSVTDELMTVSVDNVEISFLHIICTTAQAGIEVTNAADNVYIHDCSFDMFTGAANTATVGIEVTDAEGAPDFLVIRRCYFLVDSAQGPAIRLADAYQFEVDDCHMRAYDAISWAEAISVKGVTNCIGVIKNSSIYGLWGATITVGIIGASHTSTRAVVIADNRFGGLSTSDKFIDTFDSADALIVENYLASIGAGSGGALFTAIT